MTERPQRWGLPRSHKWVDVTPLVDQAEAAGIDLRPSDLPVGSMLRVPYRGAEWTLYVVPPLPDNACGQWRYVVRGERYRSLSAAAYSITGRATDAGPRFWRLRRRRRGGDDA